MNLIRQYSSPQFPYRIMERYIANRILHDVCGVKTPIRQLEEEKYNYLRSKMDRMTENDAHVIQLPSTKETEEEMVTDIIQIYEEIVQANKKSHPSHLRNCIFTITYYLTVQYKHDVILCSNILCCFMEITEKLELLRNID